MSLTSYQAAPPRDLKRDAYMPEPLGLCNRNCAFSSKKSPQHILRQRALDVLSPKQACLSLRPVGFSSIRRLPDSLLTYQSRYARRSPEIPGPRIGEARSEWEVFLEVARLVHPEWADKLTFDRIDAVREEIGRVIPTYAGIQNLNKPGHNFQYGGSMLCAGWRFPTPDGKAHFKPVKLPPSASPVGMFRVVTRRGKHFNSMVHEDTDPNNAAPRNAILINPEDAKRLGLGSGDPVELKNDVGTYRGNVMLAPVATGTLEIHWPEGNVLVDPNARSPLAAMPAYKQISAMLERTSKTVQEHPMLRV